MKARAYYNEIDTFAAEWLRELIKIGAIAEGDVDERSIEDIDPRDLANYTQCHFFAGIGVWSYALKSAGWEDARPVWTGSCPCQPFSTAGAKRGINDKRHLWPVWFGLVREQRPRVVLGEQVSSKLGLGWFDIVSTDMEREGYACGAVDICAAGFGAPHIRQRLYWMAYANGERLEERRNVQAGEEPLVDIGQGSVSYEVENTRCLGRRGWRDGDSSGQNGEVQITQPGAFDWEWLSCSDGKERPTEPGLRPVVAGPPAYMGRLRCYGNALNAKQAQAFVEAVMDYERRNQQRTLR